MKNTRSILAVLFCLSLVGMAFLSPVSTQSARATAPPIFDVFAPTATGGMYCSSGKRLDGSSNFFGDSNHPEYTWGMQTYGFASTDYIPYWAPWTDRTNFPPDNATIIDVYAVVVAVIPGGHTSTFEGIIRADGTEWRIASPAFGPSALLHYGFHAPPTYAKQLFKFNITTAYTKASGFTVLGAVNWSPMLLKSLDSGAYGGWLPATSRAFAIQYWMGPSAYWMGYGQVDYLGIEYRWRPNVSDTSFVPPVVAPGTGPGSLFPSFGSGSWLINILAISMGAVGLIGMIAYPAAAIKHHKRGSDPSESLVGAITLEFIFIGMLYAALMIA